MYSDEELREIAIAAKVLAAHAAELKVASEPRDVRASADYVAVSVRRLADRLNPDGRYGNANILAPNHLPALFRQNSRLLGAYLSTILLSLRSISRCVGLAPDANWGRGAKIDQCADDHLWLFVHEIRGSAGFAADEMRKAAEHLQAEVETPSTATTCRTQKRTKEKKPPRSKALRRFITQLKSDSNTSRSRNDIAEEVAGKYGVKPESLLRQERRIRSAEK